MASATKGGGAGVQTGSPPIFGFRGRGTTSAGLVGTPGAATPRGELVGPPEAAQPLRYFPSDKLSQDFSVFTPTFGIQYDFTDDVMAYAKWSKGFKSGGWTT